MVSMQNTQKDFRRRLATQARRADNKVCSECGDPRADWVCIVLPSAASPSGTQPIGAFCCWTCSDIHRSEAYHFVRNFKVDGSLGSSGKEEEVLALEHGGNKRVSIIFEASLDDPDLELKPDANAPRHTRTKFVREKYVDQRFCDYNLLVAYSEKLAESLQACNISTATVLAGRPSPRKKQPSNQALRRLSRSNTFDRETFNSFATSSSWDSENRMTVGNKSVLLPSAIDTMPITSTSNDLASMGRKSFDPPKRLEDSLSADSQQVSEQERKEHCMREDYDLLMQRGRSNRRNPVNRSKSMEHVTHRNRTTRLPSEPDSEGQAGKKRTFFRSQSLINIPDGSATEPVQGPDTKKKIVGDNASFRRCGPLQRQLSLPTKVQQQKRRDSICRQDSSRMVHRSNSMLLVNAELNEIGGLQIPPSKKQQRARRSSMKTTRADDNSEREHGTLSAGRDSTHMHRRGSMTRLRIETQGSDMSQLVVGKPSFPNVLRRQLSLPTVQKIEDSLASIPRRDSLRKITRSNSMLLTLEGHESGGVNVQSSRKQQRTRRSSMKNGRTDDKGCGQVDLNLDLNMNWNVLADGLRKTSEEKRGIRRTGSGGRSGSETDMDLSRLTVGMSVLKREKQSLHRRKSTPTSPTSKKEDPISDIVRTKAGSHDSETSSTPLKSSTVETEPIGNTESTGSSHRTPPRRKSVTTGRSGSKPRKLRGNSGSASRGEKKPGKGSPKSMADSGDSPRATEDFHRSQDTVGIKPMEGKERKPGRRSSLGRRKSQEKQRQQRRKSFPKKSSLEGMESSKVGISHAVPRKGSLRQCEFSYSEMKEEDVPSAEAIEGGDKQRNPSSKRQEASRLRKKQRSHSSSDTTARREKNMSSRSKKLTEVYDRRSDMRRRHSAHTIKVSEKKIKSDGASTHHRTKSAAQIETARKPNPTRRRKSAGEEGGGESKPMRSTMERRQSLRRIGRRPLDSAEKEKQSPRKDSAEKEKQSPRRPATERKGVIERKLRKRDDAKSQISRLKQVAPSPAESRKRVEYSRSRSQSSPQLV